MSILLDEGLSQLNCRFINDLVAISVAGGSCAVEAMNDAVGGGVSVADDVRLDARHRGRVIHLGGMRCEARV